MATYYMPASGGYQASTHLRYNIEIIEGAISGRTRSITVNVRYWRTNQGYTTTGYGTCYCHIYTNGTLMGKYEQAVTTNQAISYNSMTVLFTKTFNVSYDTAGNATLEVLAWASTNNDNITSGVNGETISLTNIGPPTYTVVYKGSTNDDYGFPASQTANSNTAITLSTHKPARPGYTFKNWNTVQNGSGTAYAPGASFTGSGGTIYLYAQWTINTYSVAYNANGGSGAPSAQTKTHGTALTLSSTKPTRTNYNFLGWGVSSSSTTASYAAGASYTTDAAITLYAVWELAYSYPRITNLSIFRSNSGGTASDSGTYFKISFSWATDSTVSSIKVEWKKTSATSWTSSTISASGTSGSASKVLGSNAISVESTYDVRVTVADAKGSTVLTGRVAAKTYPIDFKSGGTGTAIGKPAETANLFDVGWDAKFNKDVYFANPIGGRNYIMNSKGDNYSGWTYTGSVVTDSLKGYCMQKSITTTAEDYLGSCRINRLEPSTVYTFSMDIWINDYVSGVDVYMLTDREDNQKTGNQYVDVHAIGMGLSLTKNKWQRVYITFTSNANAYTGYVRIDNNGSTTSGTAAIMKVANLKLEKGTVRTDWTPAPEDAHPVDTIYLSYSQTSPASIFGGTWTRIASYFLYATSTNGVIGDTGYVSTDTSGSSASYIKVAAWRRIS